MGYLAILVVSEMHLSLRCRHVHVCQLAGKAIVGARGNCQLEFTHGVVRPQLWSSGRRTLKHRFAWCSMEIELIRSLAIDIADALSCSSARHRSP